MKRKHIIKGAIGAAALWSGLSGLPAAHAETYIGNGGDVIICGDLNDHGSSRAEVYDAYEGRELLYLDPVMGDSEDPVEKAKVAVARLQRLDPVRYERLNKLIDVFMTEARIIPHANLTDIPDTDPSVVPQGCSLQQLAIQYPDPAPRMPRYLINKDYWDLLDTDNKAYLILHEVIYYETIRRGAQDSKTARYFNAHLASDIFDSFSQAEYDSFLVDEMKLPPLVEVDSLTLLKDSQVFDADGTLIMGTLSVSYGEHPIDNRVWRKGNRTIELDRGSNVYFSRERLLLKGKGVIVTTSGNAEISRFPIDPSDNGFTWNFDSEGIEFEMLPNDQILLVPVSNWGKAKGLVGNSRGCYALIEANKRLLLDPNGMLLTGSPEPTWSGARVMLGSDAECASGSYHHTDFYLEDETFAFYPNGHLKRAKVRGSSVLLNEANEEITVTDGTNIQLNENGRLLSN